MFKICEKHFSLFSREFDLRTPHSCSTLTPCKNVIINLTDHVGASAEVKCIQLHPYFPELIAVGSTDPYVRLYDRRMLTKTDSETAKDCSDNTSSSSANACISYFSPGHLTYRKHRNEKPRKVKHYTTTYVSFSPDGREMLQNLGGEHIYMYKINEKRKPLVFTAGCPTHGSSSQKSDQDNTIADKKRQSKNGFSTTNGLTSTYEMRQSGNLNISFNTSGNSDNSDYAKELPEKALKLKMEGNDAFSQKNYFQATVCYNKALRLVPDSSVLYANRGAALLKRSW